ncbi:DUF3137 domain-containing protein [Candidatus Xianfuyuplasma coldseepsis]|uniref:DUF3137 domain-containing protein n=1 Tax=Candidatus Xianfuyuplasma coldseepsis TaxID=2782163 RepID=A0A7L7KVQ5_9MOLU|nr:DUF3137 domain-containing protein [Xianfuyuplasma coldseepsis]QMS85828.1 DUF3137 domain-containing protein [Xianfuyuplasma coldseepsis]
MNTNLEQYVTKKSKSEKKVYIGGALIILAVLLFLAGIEFLIFIAIPVGIAGFIVAGIGFSEFNRLSKQFKVQVVTSLVEQFVDNGHFDPHRGLSQNAVYSTEFLKRADRFHSEDFLSGSMEGVDFISSDVKLEERHVQHTKNGTRVYYETYFLGRVFVFDFNKPFDGFLQVLENGRPRVNRGYNKVQLESIAFNKKFKTYATNDHSAFYVLTPHFMEALLDFEKNNRGNIRFSFIDNHLYIGINNFRDTFELQMFRKLDQHIFDEFQRDLFVIKDVITELKLNQNIFKKGV